MKIEDRKSGAVTEGNFSIPCFKKGKGSNFRHLFVRKFLPIRYEVRRGTRMRPPLRSLLWKISRDILLLWKSSVRQAMFLCVLAIYLNRILKEKIRLVKDPCVAPNV